MFKILFLFFSPLTYDKPNGLSFKSLKLLTHNLIIINGFRSLRQISKEPNGFRWDLELYTRKQPFWIAPSLLVPLMIFIVSSKYISMLCTSASIFYCWAVLCKNIPSLGRFLHKYFTTGPFSVGIFHRWAVFY